MSAKKQIEEIARTLCAHYKTEKCTECSRYNCCMVRLDAEWLYSAGYRKLPCKIGDKVWGIRTQSGGQKAVEGIVSEMYFVDNMRLVVVVKNIARGQWGVKIFATREECEQAIERCRQ